MLPDSDKSIQVAISSLTHEIQNNLHVIKMEFDLFLIGGGEASNPQRVARAIDRITRSLQELNSISGCSTTVILEDGQNDPRKTNPSSAK